MGSVYDFAGESPVRDLISERANKTSIHSDLVDDARSARHWWEGERERHGIGYRTETEEFVNAHPSPTLRGFLRGSGR